MRGALGYRVMEYHEHIALRAALDWQIEAGVLDAIGDDPVDRYAVVPAQTPKTPAKADAAAGRTGPVAVAPKADDPVAEAQRIARSAPDLAGLAAALAAFERCDLKRGARNLVFADGTAGASVMLIGGAPSREEDRAGQPFVGRAGHLLDLMLAAIGLGRDSAYLAMTLPWRPRSSGATPAEVAMLRPFVARHVALAQPDVVILMGSVACEIGLGRGGLSRQRGTWSEAYGKPALPMYAPEDLLKQPRLKREAWADLLSLKARLDQGT